MGSGLDYCSRQLEHQRQRRAAPLSAGAEPNGALAVDERLDEDVLGSKLDAHREANLAGPIFVELFEDLVRQLFDLPARRPGSSHADKIPRRQKKTET